MEVTQETGPSDKEYLWQFSKKLTQARIPVSGSIELNHRCNLKCVHCYLGPQEKLHQMGHLEMSTEQIVGIIDDLTEAGCLFLLITGGDPLLRRDFSEIYRHAKTNGLIVTVFTNGTLITNKIVELFRDLPPRVVDISLYGATAATYESVTGIKGSFKQCLAGIRRLLDNNINVNLKTVLLTQNQHELGAMEAMAKAFGVKFRFDAGIFPTFDGDKTPTTLRVSPEEAIKREAAGDNWHQQWGDYYDKHQAATGTDALYQCGAGLNTFHVNPYGNLQPCLMTTGYQYNLSGGDFMTGWRDFIPGIRDKKLNAGSSCNGCNKRSLCGYCPAFHDLENGDETARSQYLCDMGHLRYQELYGGSDSNIRIELKSAGGISAGGCGTGLSGGGCGSGGCGGSGSILPLQAVQGNIFPVQVDW